MESGDTAEITVWTQANATITMSNNGGNQVAIGNSGSTGLAYFNFTQTASTVGSYVEIWYENGHEMDELLYQGSVYRFPQLPAFDVYPRHTAPNCPGANGDVWAYTPMSYSSTSAYPQSEITAGAGEWNGALDDLGFTYESPGFVAFSDGNLGGSTLGLTTAKNFSSYPICDDRPSYCGSTGYYGACLTSSIFYEATVALNDSLINSQTFLYPNLVQYTVTHELGHVLGLTEADATNFICSEVLSIMYSDGETGYTCGGLAPHASCDVDGLEVIYAEATVL